MKLIYGSIKYFGVECVNRSVKEEANITGLPTKETDHMKRFISMMMLTTSLFTTTSTAQQVPEEPTLGVVVGKASWYGKEEQGKLMANGHRFDRFKLTAASRSLAFGTKLKVLNIATRRAVTVTITDRGPWIKSRIIDLSEAAARVLQCAGICTVAYQIQEQ